MNDIWYLVRLPSGLEVIWNQEVYDINSLWVKCEIIRKL